MIEIVRYQDRAGREPYTDWFRDLRDGIAEVRIAARLRQIESDNLGDCQPIGAGVMELRIHVGPGYRIYCGIHGSTVVVLLCAGDKGSQTRDITRAKEYWADWKERRQ